MLKKFVKHIVKLAGYNLSRLDTLEPQPSEFARSLNVPDHEFYAPHFSPWLGYGNFPNYYNIAKPYTKVTPNRGYVLFALAQQAGRLNGDWVECGVYKGGMAMMLAKIIKEHNFNTVLHLFDTFAGMPKTDAKIDRHKKGDFSDVNFDEVSQRVQSILSEQNKVMFHCGFIPDTFATCNLDRIAFAHIDVDIYRSVLDCCQFLYPRLLGGGFLIFDDYGFATCPGARKAVDEFFGDKHECPLVLPTGQVIVFKHDPS